MGATFEKIRIDYNAHGNIIKFNPNLRGTRIPLDRVSRDPYNPQIKPINNDAVGKDIIKLWDITKGIKDGKLDFKNDKKAAELLEKLKVRPEDWLKVLEETSKLEKSKKYSETISIYYNPGVPGEKSIYLVKSSGVFSNVRNSNAMLAQASKSNNEQAGISNLGSPDYFSYNFSGLLTGSLYGKTSLFSSKSETILDLLEFINPKLFDMFFRGARERIEDQKEQEAQDQLDEKRAEEKAFEKKLEARRQAKKRAAAKLLARLIEKKQLAKLDELKFEQRIYQNILDEMLGYLQKLEKDSWVLAA